MKNYLAVFAALLCCAVDVQSQTPFTYQGRLANSNGTPASGSYDVTFTLFAVPTAGSPVSATVSNGAVSVSAEGLFTTSLDFGASIFDGTTRWLEIAVRTNGSGAFSTLVPRQLITAAPYAIYASNAANASLLGGVSASGFASNTHNHAASQITSGALSTARGGTGADTSAAVNGSILRANGAGAWTAYPPSANNQVLKIIGGVPTWSSDADTTYLAGNGLLLSGTTFSANFVGTGTSNSVARSDHTHSGADITSGTVSDARLSNNIARVNTMNTFTASNIFTGVVIATNQSNQISGAFTGSGAGLTSINGGNIAPGTIATAALADNSVTLAKMAPGTLTHLDAPDGSPLNAVSVDTNGLVGIGTNDPSAGLQVTRTAPAAVLVRVGEVSDASTVYTNLYSPTAVAAAGTLAVAASSFEGGITVFNASASGMTLRSQFRDEEGAFTNLLGAAGLALKSNLLAIAASTDDAVTLVTLTNPAAPVKLAEMKDGVGAYTALNGASSVAIFGNLLAIGAQTDNAVTLVDISNPASPVRKVEMIDGSFGFTNLAGVRSVALTTNLLAIAAYVDNTVTLVNVADPANPIKLVEMNGLNGYAYMTQPNSVTFSGNLLAISSFNGNDVSIYSF